MTSELGLGKEGKMFQVRESVGLSELNNVISVDAGPSFKGEREGVGVGKEGLLMFSKSME